MLAVKPDGLRLFPGYHVNIEGDNQNLLHKTISPNSTNAP